MCSPPNVWSFVGETTDDIGYEQLHGIESRQAYQAFKAYRDAGAGRSIQQAYTAVTGKVGRPSGRFNEWSRRYRWSERVARYDSRVLLQAEALFIRRDKEDLVTFARQAADRGARKNVLADRITSLLESRITGLKPEDIPVTLIPHLARAASALAQAGTEEQATAMGVDRLLSLLDDEEVG